MATVLNSSRRLSAHGPASGAFRARRRPLVVCESRGVDEGSDDIPDETPQPPDYDARREDEPEIPEPNGAEPIPFRLEKKNVFPSWFHVNMKVPPATLSEDVVIPHWMVQGMIPYPFWGISGGSLSDGIAATKHFEKGFSRDTHRAERTSGAITDEMFAEMRSKFPDTITSGDVVFKPFKAISAKPSGKKPALSVLGDHRDNYENVREDLVMRQLYDISGDGKIVANPKQRGRIVFTPNRRKDRELCTLVPISRYDIANECGIHDPQTCIEFLQSVKRAVEAGSYGHENVRSLTRGGVNPTFGKYEGYFGSLGCVDGSGRIDMDKYISLVRAGKPNPMQVVEQLVIPFLFPADFSRTFVWVPIASGRIPAADRKSIDKAVEIFRRLQAGEKPVQPESDGQDGDDPVEGDDTTSEDGESATESAVNEAIKGLSDEAGDIVGNTWKEKFFFAMISAKQQASKKVLTFLTRGKSKEATIVGNEVLVRGRPMRADRASYRMNGNVMREFIVIDGVRDSLSGMDYTPFFKSKTTGGILDQKAVKKFLFKVISGVCVSFPYDPEVEASSEEFRSHRRKIDNMWRYDRYCERYSVRANDLQSFYVTVMCPSGKGDDPDSWFFFNSYQEAGNPTAGNVAIPEDLVDALAAVLPSREHPFRSVMWYNECTSKDTGKINVLTGGRGVDKAASGRVIGATDR